MRNERPFGLTMLDLAMTVVAIAVIATGGFWAAVAADAAIESYARAQSAAVFEKIDKNIADRAAAEAAVIRRVAALRSHADATEAKLHVDLDCSRASRAFQDAQREAAQADRDERFEALMERKAADLAAAEALMVAARWKAERAQRRQAALGLMVVGQMAEGMGKAQPAGFKASFLRQFGVQLQVTAMELTGATYANPALATAQGFLIGL